MGVRGRDFGCGCGLSRGFLSSSLLMFSVVFASRYSTALGTSSSHASSASYAASSEISKALGPLVHHSLGLGREDLRLKTS